MNTNWSQSQLDYVSRTSGAGEHTIDQLAVVWWYGKNSPILMGQDVTAPIEGPTPLP